MSQQLMQPPLLLRFGDTFVSFEFVSNIPGKKAIIRWNEPDRVIAEVELPEDAPDKRFEYIWKGQPAAAQKIYTLLGDIRDLNLRSGDDYTLNILRNYLKVSTLMWSSKNETREYLALRNALEEAGHLACTRALAYLKRSETLASRRDLPEAIRSVKEGIRALGDQYRDQSIVDDTGTKLVFGEANEKKGKLDVAFNLFKNVLQSRIETYIRLYNS